MTIDNPLIIPLFMLFVFLCFAGWVLWRGPVERMQSDGTPYPKNMNWRNKKDFVGPLEPCSCTAHEDPSGFYQIVRSSIRSKEIKWFGADFDSIDINNWLHKSGYSCKKIDNFIKNKN